MTITFDRIGHCPRPAVHVVECYAPKDGRAHGSLDAMVRVCDACHEPVRQRIVDSSMAPYTRLNVGSGVCGDRTTYS